jgi:hypothetical protein
MAHAGGQIPNCLRPLAEFLGFSEQARRWVKKFIQMTEKGLCKGLEICTFGGMRGQGLNSGIICMGCVKGCRTVWIGCVEIQGDRGSTNKMEVNIHSRNDQKSTNENQEILSTVFQFCSFGAMYRVLKKHHQCGK